MLDQSAGEARDRRRHERETCERRMVVRVSLVLLLKHANLKIIRRSSGGKVCTVTVIVILKAELGRLLGWRRGDV